MNLARCPNPSSYERGNDIRVLPGWARANLGLLMLVRTSSDFGDVQGLAHHQAA